MSAFDRPGVASAPRLEREALPGTASRVRDPLVRLADSREILQQVLTPTTARRRLLPQLAGLLGAAWLRRRVWQPVFSSELPPWRRAACLLLTLWPTPSQWQRARLARLAANPRTLP